MKKSQVETSLGSIGVSVSFIDNPRTTLFFWPGMFFDGSMWDEIVEEFIDQYNLVVVDPLGHGSSSSPEGYFSILDCANVVSEILEYYKVESTIIVGLSWGGFVAQSFSKHFSEMCEGMILINTCASPARSSEKLFFFLLPKLLSWFGVKHFESALVDNLLSEKSIKDDYVLVSKVKNYLRALNYSSLKNVLYSVMREREDLEYCASDSAVKSMIIYGELDKAMDKERTDRLMSLYSQSQVVSLPVGHNAVLENPKAVIDSLNEFLS